MFLIEIFRSIQGESTFTGVPCTFVRFAGCNLRCNWCDSEYTFSGGIKKSIDEVLTEVAKLSPTGLVEITGGEPLLQEGEAVALMQALLDRGYTVLLETGGERLLSNVPKEVHVIADVKCPGSSEGGSFNPENIKILDSNDEAKFVLTDRADYEFARDFIRTNSLEKKLRAVLLSPAFQKTATGTRDSANCVLDPRDLAQWILEDGLNVRLGLQVHKFIWDPATKGV